LPGPYNFGDGKTVILYLNNSEDATTVTLSTSEGVTTAAQAVTALNAGLPASMVASAFMTNYVQITTATKGSASSIKLGSGTANSVFGWIDGSIVNHLPLRAPAWYGVAYENLEGLVPSYPACILRGASIDLDDNMQLVGYTVNLRLREVCSTPDFGGVLYHNLVCLAEIVVDVLHDSGNVSLVGQVNHHKIDNVRPSQTIEVAEAGMIGAYVDFNIRLTVQEE
jgi:hypothetical protein